MTSSLNDKNCNWKHAVSKRKKKHALLMKKCAGMKLLDLKKSVLLTKKIRLDEIARQEEIRLNEVRRQDKIRAEDIEREMRWREEEATRRQEADVKAAERESEKRGERESAVNRAKRFGDAIKASLFQMGHDPMEMPSFFRHVESVFSRFKVPGDLQADLLQPFLNAKARTIVARMDPLSSRRYETVRDLILKEHKLTPATYLEHFNCITRPENETCVMFGARLKALLEQYVRSRKVDASFEGLMSLLLSDRIKATLGDGCLRHILSVELHAERGWLDAGELAEAVDTYLANHFANDKPRATAIGQKFENFKTSPPSNNSYQKQETQSNSGQFRSAQNKKDDPMQYKQQKQSDSPAASNRKTGLCFNCRSTEHYKRDCPLLRQTHQSKNQKVNRCRITDTTEFENSEQKTKICEEQILKMDAGCQVENDNIVAVENCNFVQQDNIFRNVSPLKYIDVKIDEVANASIRALDDSGSEICVIKSSIIDHNTLAVLQPMGTVRLRGIVGAPIETKLVKLHVSLVSNGDANAENRLPIVCAVCPELNEDMILTSTIVKQLMYCSHVNAISADAGMQATANGADSSDLDDVDSLDDQTQTSSHSQGNPATSDGRVANTDILRQEQLNDESLKTAWNAAAKGKAGYTVENELLYHTEKIVSIGEKCQQLCLPEQRRKAVLELAHCTVGCDKHFQVGEMVLILTPDSTSSRTFSRWQGPAQVVKVCSPYSYIVEHNSNQHHLHANKLKPFVVAADEVTCCVDFDTVCAALSHSTSENEHDLFISEGCAVITDADQDFGEIPSFGGYVGPGSESPTLPSQKIDQTQIAHLSIEKQQALLELLDKFSSCFSDDPGLCTLAVHEINLTPDFRPKRLRAYRVPEKLKPLVSIEIQRMLDLGVIRPSNSDMVSPLVVILKGRDGRDGIRLAVDYSYVNKYTRNDPFPVQEIDSVIQRVGAAKLISCFDLSGAYWQTRIRTGDEYLTAFICDEGVYEFVRTPFGGKASGSTFIRAIQQVLRPVKRCTDAYVDDVLVFSSDEFSQHLKDIEAFLERIREAKMTLKLKKCRFALPEVKFCGKLIGSGFKRPDPEKIAAVQNMRIPRTKTQVRQLLGFFSFFRDHVPNFAAIARPITDLTAKRVPNTVPWTEVHDQSFTALKEALCQATDQPLRIADLNLPFSISVDASDYAVAGYLSQSDATGVDHPLAFFSCKLSESQRAWATVHKEAYAVLVGLRKFRNWIFGSEMIHVYSDHNPLTFLTESAPKNAKLMRWSLALQEFNLSFHYIKGRLNVAPDCLSRMGPD